MVAYAEADTEKSLQMKKLVVLLVGAPLGLAIGVSIAIYISSHILSARASELSTNAVATQNKRAEHVAAFYNSHRDLYQSMLSPDFDAPAALFKDTVSERYGRYESAAQSICKSSVVLSRDVLLPMSKLQITDSNGYTLYSTLSSNTLPMQAAYGCNDNTAKFIYDKWSVQYITVAFSMFQIARSESTTASAAAKKELYENLAAITITDKDYDKINTVYGEQVTKYMKEMPLSMELSAETMSGNINAISDPKYAELVQGYESGERPDSDEIQMQQQAANTRIQKGLVDDTQERYSSILALHNKSPIKNFDKNSWLVEILPAALAEYAETNELRLPEAASLEQVVGILETANIIKKDLDFSGFTFSGTESEYTITAKIGDKTITLRDSYGAADAQALPDDGEQIMPRGSLIL